MTILIGQLEFDGPFCQPSEIEPKSGLYALLCESEDEYELVEIDQTDMLPTCLENEEYASNLTFLQEVCNGKIWAAVHYTEDLTTEERIELKEDLLSQVACEEQSILS